MKDDEEKLSGALQENLLVVLCFNDDYCKMVRHGVTPQLFESAVYREVAGHAIDYIDQFGTAIKEHLPDSLEHILNGDNTRKADSFKKLLENLFQAKDSVNAEFVVSQLHKFVRLQTFKSALIEAVEAVEDGKLESAEVAMQKGLQKQSLSFEMGTLMSDTAGAMSYLEQDAKPLMIGIGPLDDRGIGLARKEQMLFVAPAKAGKTWFAIHCARWALMQRQTVLHISLEMSEDKMKQRYHQAFFSVSKRESEIQVPLLRKNDDGGLSEVLYEKVRRDSFENPKIREILIKKIQKEFGRRKPLIIKQFPTGQLTVAALEAYLDGLERYHKIVPDVVIIDYPKLMQLDNANLRTSLGSTHEQLRGLAVARNHAQLVLAQASKEGARSQTVDATHAGEDWSMIATADTVLTYSQTTAEKKMGLARIFAAAVRGDEDKFMVLMAQAYGLGQFCLDACLMSNDYFEMVEASSGRGGRRGRQDDDEDD